MADTAQGGRADSPAKAWQRALELTASIPRNPQRTFSVRSSAWRQARGPAQCSGRQGGIRFILNTVLKEIP